MPTKSILLAALCAVMAGCVTDGDAEGTPLTPHQAYVSFLARHQNDTVTIYAEDTLTIRGGKRATHGIITIADSSYNGFMATQCTKLSIDAEATFLEMDCGPRFDSSFDTIIEGSQWSFRCSEKKPADF